MTEDPYLRDIKQKAITSDLMSEICSGTLANSIYARVVDGWDMPFLDFSGKYLCVVHSAGGDPRESDVGKHAASLVDRLVAQAKVIGAAPVAFTNVIDANKIEGGMDGLIKEALLSRANHYRLVALPGETAILGSRVRDVNMSGTMISIVPKNGKFTVGTYTDSNTGAVYAIFDPGKELVTANSDGIGTKTDCYDRADRREEGVDDEFAMLDDDTSRYGGVVRVSSSLVETRGDVNFDAICKRASCRGEEMGFTAIMQREDVGDRIRGYTSATYNISGTVVCTVSDYRLMHPLKPSAGEHVIAIRSKTPNPRSNGLTDKRDAMVAMFGEDWHAKEDARPFLEYLTSPSVILYPLFRRLTDSGVGKSVCHMSGHSFKKKLAGPFAKEELFVRLKNIFLPDERDLAMARAIGSLPKSAARALPENLYAKWPLNHDGFVTTNNPEEAIRIIEEFGFEARDAGVLEEAKIINGKLKTGVELKDIKDSKGDDIYFDGRN